MASKLQTTIKLMQKGEDGKYKPKQFKSAEFLPGSVSEDAAEVQQGMLDSETAEEVKASLMTCYDFIADVIFEGQFTGEEYRDGIDARDIAPLTGKLLRSVTQGYENTYAETKKK